MGRWWPLPPPEPFLSPTELCRAPGLLERPLVAGAETEEEEDDEEAEEEEEDAGC